MRRGRGRPPRIREVEAHRKPIPKKTWKRGEPEEKLKEVVKGISDLVARRKAWLQYLGKEFEDTHNPLCPWDARSMARKWGLPVPRWVEEYLDRAGKKLLHAENKTEILSLAFGFKADTGGSSQFRQYELRHAKEYALALAEDLIRQGEQVDWAIGKAAHEAEKALQIPLSSEVILNYRLEKRKKDRKI
jgi:hypothetical protein